MNTHIFNRTTKFFIEREQLMSYDKELVAHKLGRWENYLNNYKLPAWKELPDIGLYMDQVIALLGQYLDFIPVEDQKNKPVTPTTINNYVRLKVMPAPEKRKYYRIHIAYLIMILTLKMSLSIGEIQKLLPPDLDEAQMQAMYLSYSEKFRTISLQFCQQMQQAAEEFRAPQHSADMAAGRMVIEWALHAGFNRLLAQKVIALKDADAEAVLSAETDK